jgi:hypothetical protein
MARSESLGEFRVFDRMAYRHTIMDGLTEAALAIFLLTLAVVLPHGPAALLLCLAPFGLVPAWRYARRRWVEPRIGYVEPMADKPRDILPGIGLFFLVVLAAAMVLALAVGGSGGGAAPLAQRLRAWEPGLGGVLVAGGLWYAASRSGLKRFYAYAAVSVSLGLALAASGDLILLNGRRAGIQWYLLAMGTLLGVGGATVFACFLRRHPIASSGENGARR